MQNEKQYAYCFDELTVEQVNSATVLFNLYLEMTQSPPKNIDQLVAGGMLDIQPRALAYIINPYDGECVLQFRRNGYSESLEFVRSLKATAYADILKIKQDFFAKAGIVDVESLKPLRATIAAFAGLNLTEIQGQAESASAALKNSSESNHSTIPMNTNAD